MALVFGGALAADDVAIAGAVAEQGLLRFADNTDLRRLIAVAKMRAGEPQRAVVVMQALVRRYATTPDDWQLLAQAAAADGDQTLELARAWHGCTQRSAAIGVFTNGISAGTCCG